MPRLFELQGHLQTIAAQLHQAQTAYVAVEAALAHAEARRARQPAVPGFPETVSVCVHAEGHPPIRVSGEDSVEFYDSALSRLSDEIFQLWDAARQVVAAAAEHIQQATAQAATDASPDDPGSTIAENAYGPNHERPAQVSDFTADGYSTTHSEDQESFDPADPPLPAGIVGGPGHPSAGRRARRPG